MTEQENTQLCNDWLYWVWYDQELFCDDDQLGVVLNACSSQYLIP